MFLKIVDEVWHMLLWQEMESTGIMKAFNFFSVRFCFHYCLTSAGSFFQEAAKTGHATSNSSVDKDKVVALAMMLAVCSDSVQFDIIFLGC